MTHCAVSVVYQSISGALGVIYLCVFILKCLNVAFRDVVIHAKHVLICLFIDYLIIQRCCEIGCVEYGKLDFLLTYSGIYVNIETDRNGP